MKLLLIAAIEIALSSVAVLTIQSVSAAPSDPYNPYAPGFGHAGIAQPQDP